MRTVDPELWSRKMKRHVVQTTPPSRFGQQQASCGLETRLRQSLWDALAEFWKNCSLAAAQYYQHDENKYERRLEARPPPICTGRPNTSSASCRWRHVFLLVLTLVAGWVLLLHNSKRLESQPPLIVSLQTDDNSIRDYKFPAVALCSNQIISKAALKNLTKYFYKHPKNKEYRYRESQIQRSLLDMGALLTLALPPMRIDFEKFVLDVEKDFNVTDIMFRLSANCSTILKRCSWRGDLVPCEHLFASRLTALGFCCVFNSRYQPGDVEHQPAVLDLVGRDYGLGVVVNEIRDDVAYERRPTYGMELLLFEGEEFPLLESGDVRLYPLPRNATVFLNVRALSQLPADHLSHYTDDKRGCLLEGGGMSWCLAQCRRDTAEALCGCVPYALQPQFVPALAPTCTLGDLTCLNKHREKFMYVYPGDDAHPSLSQEVQDALYCPDCMVQCRRQLFSASVSYTAYSGKPHVFRNFLSANISLINSTTIRLFYSIDHQQWYKVEGSMRWFENFVKLGTQWLVITGVSILNFSELLYHGTFRWLHHFIRRTRIARMQPVATSK
ncbi:hypothetical protein PYW08_007396 [Mythimna loreyi]|uniref:Uncharacterized protein n=1 Tax=Mythimna loreyi TaxID=667449 RepID=A0ACC2QEA1_9NEOP|nr:hypothetical protein PYW08_007396 [Mythimna loreyi]